MFAHPAQVAFGEAVRQQRIALHISQEELAYRSGLHRTYISDVERGARNLSLQSIEKLAQALKLSVSALFAAANAPAGDRAVEILLVEDNVRDAEMTLRAFRKARLTNAVHVVPDGAAALDYFFGLPAQTERAVLALPGLILLDLNLPKVDGIEVLRRIKEDKRTKHIPVIVLTASDRDMDISRCQRLGAASYIVKPVGFQNFSEVTSHLPLDWALKKAPEERENRR